ACLALPDMRVAKKWGGWPPGSWRADFADTMDRYARVDRNGTVSVRRMADDAQLYHLSGFGAEVADMILSPNGKFLAYFLGGRLGLWKLDGKEPVRLLEEKLGAISFSPDSRQFIHTLPDGSICLYDLPSAKKIKELGVGPRENWGVILHPKDRQFALCHAGGIQIRDLDSGSVVTELEQPGASRFDWSSDGKSLAVAVWNDRSIRIWDVASRKEKARLEGHKNSGIECTFNHAG